MGRGWYLTEASEIKARMSEASLAASSICAVSNLRRATLAVSSQSLKPYRDLGLGARVWICISFFADLIESNQEEIMAQVS